MQVLMIEDDDTVGKPIELWLERQGHTLFWCESVRDFFALKEAGFDAIITDFYLGDGTGLMVLQALEARGSTCPVLLHSSETTFMMNGHQTPTPIGFLANPELWSFPVTVEDKASDRFVYLKRFFESCLVH